MPASAVRCPACSPSRCCSPRVRRSSVRARASDEPKPFEGFEGVPGDRTEVLNGYIRDPGTYGPRLIAIERESGGNLPPIFRMATADAYLRAGNRRAAEQIFEASLAQNPGLSVERLREHRHGARSASPAATRTRRSTTSAASPSRSRRRRRSATSAWGGAVGERTLRGGAGGVRRRRRRSTPSSAGPRRGRFGAAMALFGAGTTPRRRRRSTRSRRRPGRHARRGRAATRRRAAASRWATARAVRRRCASWSKCDPRKAGRRAPRAMRNLDARARWAATGCATTATPAGAACRTRAARCTRSAAARSPSRRCARSSAAMRARTRSVRSRWPRRKPYRSPPSRPRSGARRRHRRHRRASRRGLGADRVAGRGDRGVAPPGARSAAHENVAGRVEPLTSRVARGRSADGIRSCLDVDFRRAGSGQRRPAHARRVTPDRARPAVAVRLLRVSRDAAAARGRHSRARAVVHRRDGRGRPLDHARLRDRGRVGRARRHRGRRRRGRLRPRRLRRPVRDPRRARRVAAVPATRATAPSPTRRPRPASSSDRALLERDLRRRRRRRLARSARRRLREHAADAVAQRGRRHVRERDLRIRLDAAGRARVLGVARRRRPRRRPRSLHLAVDQRPAGERQERTPVATAAATSPT